ncbi:E3 ubiquitin/ISG15 ligase TRIM25-like [Salvelinus namaycush]|uniref:E3 ubiquitin/ISG15 ligase TRIM25-like n=1 Tax=Salvelinus namaycush TaxID=8040 RepID=A0A8U0R041_SALNM|nr:E3 ubiquitin/ISG15 ligase TRIM25-like [Salvelinus namaycush]
MDSISCSICLDLLKDPVTIPCGHSYCKGCIKGYWSLDDQKGIHSCPQCRQTFTPRPALNRNILLAELVEKLKTDFKTVPSASCFFGPEDVKYDRDDSAAAAERKEKQGQLREKRQQVGLTICVREKEMQDIRQALMSLSLSAQAAVEHCELVFAELIRSIERRRWEVKELISAHQRASVSQTEGLLVRMEQEIAELKRRDKELEQLAQTEDNINFLKTFQSLCVAPGTELLPYITANQHFSFEEVKSSISGMMERMEDVLKEEMVQITGKVTAVSEVYVLSPRPELMAAAEVHFHHEPKTRVEFLENYCHLTLDPNSAYQHLRLSECNREVSWSDKALSYSDHPDRFTDHYQVLCKEDLSGTHYCEVDRRGECEVAITYRSISRKGGLECCFGSNDQSWSLVCRNSSCSYWHNKNRTDIPVPCSTRVGVYLDSRAGTLAFYSVSDTMTLLHRVQTTFTDDLCAGFWVGPGCGSSVALC